MGVFENSINQWCYGTRSNSGLPKTIEINGRPCYYSNNTEVQRAVCDDKEVTIIGTCFNAVKDEWGGVQCLCSLDLEEFIVAIEELCGAYVIFRVDKQGVKIFGDASHLIGVYYGIGKQYGGMAASCEALIVDAEERVSQKAEDVIRGAYSGGLYLAGDMTVYDSIRCLLPNHYLDMSTMAAKRYFPRAALMPVHDISEIDSIIDATLEMVSRGIRQYASKTLFALPLTPGGDSRVNCALVRGVVPNVNAAYYVISNVELQREPDNVSFIKAIADRMGITDFKVLPEVDVLDDERLEALKKECGRIRAWGRKLWCYHPILGGRAIVKGELIDQIGKSPYGRAMPEWMASKFFLKTILSNTSRQADIEFSKWYENAKANRKGYSMFDLYSWEIRCGRWNSNTHSISNINGVSNINFFNCTKVLAEWCRIPRRERKNKCIHRRFISKTMPSVVDFPVNPYAYRHSRHLTPALSKIIPYWCRWIAQYYMQLIKLLLASR